MFRSKRVLVLPLTFAALVVAGCGKGEAHDHPHDHAHDQGTAAVHTTVTPADGVVLSAPAAAPGSAKSPECSDKPSSGATASASAAAGVPGSKRTVYTAHASGGGWGAADKARAALESLTGVTGLKMSGTVGAFTLCEGKLDEATVRAAIEEAGLTFDLLEVAETIVPFKTLVLEAEGPTWATTITKVRSDLMKLGGIGNVIFGEQVEVEIIDLGAWDRTAFEKGLADGGFTLTKWVSQ